MSDTGHPDNNASAAPPVSSVGTAATTARLYIPWARPVLSDFNAGAVRLASPLSGEGASALAAFPQALDAHAEEPLLLMRLSKWATVFDIVIIVAVWIIAEIALAGLAIFTSDTPVDLDEGMSALKDWLVPMAVVHVVVIGGAIALLTRLRKLPAASVGMTGRRILLCIPIGIGVGVAILLMMVPVELGLSQVPGLQEGLEANPKQILEWMPQLGVGGFLGLALAVGVFEELLFRGFLMPRLRRLTGSWPIAVALSGGLFTVLHLGEQQAVAMIPIAMLAVSFSVVTIKTRSLVPAIVAHAVFDFVQFLAISAMAGAAGATGGAS